MNNTAGKLCFKVFSIVSVLLFISMLFLPKDLFANDNSVNATDNTQQKSGLVKSEFLSTLIAHGEKEAKKRIEWNTGYDLLKYYNQNGYFQIPEEERKLIMTDEWLKQKSDALENDIKDAFSYTLKEDLRNLPFVVRLERSLRSATSFKAKREEAPANPKKKFEYLAPSLKGKAVEMEMEIDRIQRELDILGDLNSPEGQLKKLALTRDIRQLKSEVAKYYPFRANISARANAKKDSGDYVAKVSPYLRMAYRSFEFETRYNLRNKTRTGISDFQFVLNGLITPDIEISVDYEPMSKKVSSSATMLLSDSIIGASYTLGYDKKDNSLGASYTKILGKDLTIIFSGSGTEQKEPSSRIYQGMVNLSYRF
jgi:hypothetical protein